MRRFDIIEHLQARLNRSDDMPRYARLAQAVVQAIDEGVLAHGRALPSERVFAEQLKISRVTVRKALASLTSAGVVVRKPVAHELSTVPTSVLADPMSVGESLYATLASLGAGPVRGVQRMRAVAATPSEADALGCKVGAPLFATERRCFSKDGRCVEFTQTRYLGSAYDFVADLQ
ncbi:MAG: GntR family transcriptional regulator [Pseudomonadota bacterium]